MKQVGNGDGSDNDRAWHFTPLGGHGTEYFDQSGHQRKGGCTFRDNRQVNAVVGAP